MIGRLAKFRSSEGGSILVHVGLTLPVLLGIASLAVDWSNVLQTQRALQASTDAAALAGASTITGKNTPSQVITAATGYGSSSGQKNSQAVAGATVASGFPQIKCLTTIGIACTGLEGGNTVVVKQTATVGLFAAQALGLATVEISATATAVRGGASLPLNVMFVLDTTASMNTADARCSIANATRLQCALSGMQAIMQQLDPATAQIGLMVFPGLSNAAQVPYEFCNPKRAISTAPYSGTPVYQVIGLSATPTAGGGASTDYRTGSSTALNTSSNLVKSAGGDPTCSGVQAPGGQGTYYADVINAAQAALVAASRPGVQNVIIFLSDGDANSNKVAAPKSTNQCHQAVTAAQNAAKAGTWVYSIAYGAQLSGCSTDSPAISPCSTMQQIASDASKFYSDNAGGCKSTTNSLTELVAIFKDIAISLTKARLVPDKTT